MHPKKSRKRPLSGISVYAEACNRTGVSNREIAFFLQGVGVITENDTLSALSLVIDKCKIQRVRKQSKMNIVTLNSAVIHLPRLHDLQ